jgi:hypothetical protein
MEKVGEAGEFLARAASATISARSGWRKLYVAGPKWNSPNLAGTDGPTDFANAVLGPLAAIGFWFLAYYLYRHGAVIRLTDKGLPAWTRWAVPLAALTGAVIGGRLAYGEVRIVGWSTTSAGALAVAVTGITVLMVLIAFRLVQRQMK